MLRYNSDIKQEISFEAECFFIFVIIMTTMTVWFIIIK